MNLPDIIDHLNQRGFKPVKSGTGWQSRCPAHKDRNPSLSISEGQGGRIVLHCHAGCTPQAVAGELGVKLRDLFPDTPRLKGSASKSRIVATYDYQDENGKPLYQYCRWEPGFNGDKKSMRARRPAPDKPGKWINSIQGVRRVLYCLPEILAAKAKGETIFLVDGEKDVDAIRKQGFIATCNPCGGGNWSDDYTTTLTGAHVVIIADKDKPKKRRDGSVFIPGREHAAKKSAALVGKAASLRCLELPDVDTKAVKDAADFFTAGGTADQLRQLASEAKEFAAQVAAVAATADALNPNTWLRNDFPRWPKSTANPWHCESQWAGVHPCKT